MAGKKRKNIRISVPMLEVRAPEDHSGKSLLAKMFLWALDGERSMAEVMLMDVLQRGRN